VESFANSAEERARNHYLLRPKTNGKCNARYASKTENDRLWYLTHRNLDCHGFAATGGVRLFGAIVRLPYPDSTFVLILVLQPMLVRSFAR
jgi:hypothetical protein